MLRRPFVALLAPVVFAASCWASSATASAAPKVFVFPVVHHATDANVVPSVSGDSSPSPSTTRTKDLIVGKGKVASAQSTVSVLYLGASYRTGKNFNLAWTKGQPVSFPLNEVIPGFRDGIIGMAVGGRRLIVIPPSQAYGDQSNGPITKNETLTFVVELLGVTNPTPFAFPAVSGGTNFNAAPKVSADTTTAPPTTRYLDLIVGTGAQATSSSTVLVRYLGANYATGAVFNDTWTSGGPISFPLNGVIPGFKIGITGMRVGGRRLIVIPSTQGYGAQANGPITANENLTFIVDLLKVTK